MMNGLGACKNQDTTHTHIYQITSLGWQKVKLEDNFRHISVRLSSVRKAKRMRWNENDQKLEKRKTLFFWKMFIRLAAYGRSRVRKHDKTDENLRSCFSKAMTISQHWHVLSIEEGGRGGGGGGGLVEIYQQTDQPPMKRPAFIDGGEWNVNFWSLCNGLYVLFRLQDGLEGDWKGRCTRNSLIIFFFVLLFRPTHTKHHQLVSTFLVQF